MRCGEDVSWQSQFAGAVKWSTLGVVADGVTDNTAALNALPADTPIIGDAPAGSFIYAADAWKWKSGLTIWQQPGVLIKSGVAGFGLYAITGPVFISNTPITNVQYYGLNISMATPTDSCRIMLLYIDHFKLKHFSVDGCGGFAIIRGSDQEIAYGTVKNCLLNPGNPGIRHVGNTPLVPTSVGMRANVWLHHLNIQCGDGVFQSGQPLGTSAWTNVSTDGFLCENCWGSSYSSGVMLINEPNPSTTPNSPDQFSNYYVRNVTYRNINGTGHWGALIFSGGDLGETSNILVDGGVIESTVGVLPAFMVGDITAGGHTSTSGKTKDITLKNLTVTGPNVAYSVVNASNFSHSNNTFNGSPWT